METGAPGAKTGAPVRLGRIQRRPRLGAGHVTIRQPHSPHHRFSESFKPRALLYAPSLRTGRISSPHTSPPFLSFFPRAPVSHPSTGALFFPKPPPPAAQSSTDPPDDAGGCRRVMAEWGLKRFFPETRGGPGSLAAGASTTQRENASWGRKKLGHSVGQPCQARFL